MIGSFFAHYNVTAKLGAGGISEVYRATDTRLGRDVAIKVLPSALAGDRDRLARFEREAQLLAALNHPNIAGIYGLEDAGGTRALVMELVEGDTLAQRLAGGALPLLSPSINRLLRTGKMTLSSTGSLTGEVQKIRGARPR